jgi:hypothetical protein
VKPFSSNARGALSAFHSRNFGELESRSYSSDNLFETTSVVKSGYSGEYVCQAVMKIVCNPAVINCGKSDCLSMEEKKQIKKAKMFVQCCFYYAPFAATEYTPVVLIRTLVLEMISRIFQAVTCGFPVLEASATTALSVASLIYAF